MPLWLLAELHDDQARDNRCDRESETDLGAVLSHEVGGPVAVKDGEVALSEIADAAADHDRKSEPQRRYGRRGREEHECLERHWRWQQRRYYHCQQAVFLIQ